MPLINLNLTDNFCNHIDNYRFHFKIRTRTEAIRVLLLKGFEAEGNPLVEEETFKKPGRPATEKAEPKPFVGNPKDDPNYIPTAREIYFKVYGVEAPEDYDAEQAYVNLFKDDKWE